MTFKDLADEEDLKQEGKNSTGSRHAANVRTEARARHALWEEGEGHWKGCRCWVCGLQLNTARSGGGTDLCSAKSGFVRDVLDCGRRSMEFSAALRRAGASGL